MTTTPTPKKRGRPNSTGAKLPAKSKATPRVKVSPAVKETPAAVAPATNSLPVNPFIFEILELASAQKTNAKKVEVLQNYEHASVKTVFVWNFDSSVISLLPPGEVPYGETNAQTTFAGNLAPVPLGLPLFFGVVVGVVIIVFKSNCYNFIRN